MSFQAVFKRYEIKYLLSREQKNKLISLMAPYMELDKYGRTVISSIYYDTGNYRLARRSMEKPVYKEKLRVRSYGRAEPDSTVFVELKKKYDSVVYKRRMALPERVSENWLKNGVSPGTRTQIEGEIAYFLEYYGAPAPKMFISYEREAFYDPGGSNLRVTFDENILARPDRLSLCERAGGIPLLERGRALMEVKTPGAMPLWLTSFLSENRIFKTSFSKYGTAYEKIILAEKGVLKNVC